MSAPGAEEMQSEGLRANGEIILRGMPAVPGLALGPILMYRKQEAAHTHMKLPRNEAAIAAEQESVRNALASAGVELEQLAVEVRATIGSDGAGIFEAQSLIATDPSLLELAIEIVASRALPAYEAILAAAGEQAELLASLNDPYLRERAADIRDVGKRAAHLAIDEPQPPDIGTLARPSIILAEDLTPSETVRLDRERLLGIGLFGGGPTSHVAVVARALGVPLVCGLGLLAYHPSGDLPGGEESAGPNALLDGNAGQLILYPDADRLADYQTWAAEKQRVSDRQVTLHTLPARTPDGHTMRLVANAGSTEDAAAAITHGAEGIGLLRTEFLFLDHLPGEEEQIAAYRAIYQAMPAGEVIVRTMDLGGDKPPPYLDFGQEANPFLGWRGIRVALDQADMLHTQVRALLRACPGRTTHLMFPMVTTLNELRAARAIVERVRRELAEDSVPMATKLEVGIMIEVPAAALMADALAPHVDFFSIGTNDLIQYTMAADRGATKVAHLYSPLQPSVLRLIDMTVKAAHGAGKWVGMCGEAAGNPEWAALWLGLGLDELSMSPASIPAVKEAIRSTQFDEAQALAANALKQATVEEVEAGFRKYVTSPEPTVN